MILKLMQRKKLLASPVHACLDAFESRGRARTHPMSMRAWLSWTPEALACMAEELGLTWQEGMSVEVRPHTDRRELRCDDAFGYYLAPAKQ